VPERARVNGDTVEHELRTALEKWGRLWGDSRLAADMSVTFSRRLRVTLGRAYPAEGRVVLHAGLQHVSVVERLSVLCHEAAHVAAWRIARAHGAITPRAHGPEWEQLVRAAGYTPRACITGPTGLTRATTRRQPAVLKAVHTCPVCHTRRAARRPVSRWRCAECIAAGLDGRLVITRQPAGDSPDMSRSGA
jgi:ribosomal protein L37AE/L43A